MTTTTNHTRTKRPATTVTALRRRRQARDLSQEELAEMVGVDQTAVSHWERGNARPHRRSARKLEAIFGLPLDDLLKNENAGPKAGAEPATATTTDGSGTHDEG